MIEKLLNLASSEVKTALFQASQKTGVDFKYLLSKAFKESSFRKDVEASSSSATGLFQFVKSTWLAVVKNYGHECGLDTYQKALKTNHCDPGIKANILALRKDPKLSSFMAAKLTQENTRILEKHLGRPPNDKELYLAHFMGPSAASQFLLEMSKAPNASPCDNFKKCAAANRAIFLDQHGKPRSYRAVFDKLTSHFDAEKPSVKTFVDKRPAFSQTMETPNVSGKQNLSSWLVLSLLEFQERESSFFK